MRHFLFRVCVLLLIAASGGACTNTAGIEEAPPVIQNPKDDDAVRDTIQESPLATWDPSGVDIFSGLSSGEGTLEITPSCVRIIYDSGDTALLVWAEPASWNASHQLIEFMDYRGNRIRLINGDRISAGGSGTDMSADGADRFPFVSPPDPSCKADELFILNSISIIEEWILPTWDPAKSESDTLSEAFSGVGKLEFDDRCVRLVQTIGTDRRSILLVWPEPTSWFNPSRAIDFVDVSGSQMILRNDVRIEALGYEVVPAPNELGKPIPDEIKVVSPPANFCWADAKFVVRSVSLVPYR